MEQERKSIRIGLWAIAIAMAFRLVSGGALQPVVEFLLKPETASFLTYLQTGRIVRTDAPLPETEATTVPETQPAATEPTFPQSVPSFRPEDASAINLHNYTEHQPDLQTLLTQPLNWQLRCSEPTVLIVHTHTTESYTPDTETYTESSAFRTLDEQYNVISIGDTLASLLEAGGIHVIHDKTYHDYPEYTGAYGRSGRTISEYLAEYPSICMVLDIHRDAVEYSNGTQMTTQASVNGVSAAQLMLVVGTDENLPHPDWETNLAFAAKLQLVLERETPGICRPISLRSERFNQELCPGSLLIEVGAAGNTRAEALAAIEALAQGILALADGCVTEYSTS